jgi:hypothetical protein
MIEDEQTRRDAADTQPQKRKKPNPSKSDEDVKLFGFDRTPGWHRKKNVKALSGLKDWVRTKFFSL